MPALHLGGVALIALLGFGGALCHIAAYRSGSAVVVAPMQYSQILWAVLYGAAFFGETPDRNTAIGAGDHHRQRDLRRLPRGARRRLRTRPVLAHPSPLRHRHLPAHQLAAAAVPPRSLKRRCAGRPSAL